MLARYVAGLGSAEVRKPTECEHEVQGVVGEAQYVCIDGSSKRSAVGRRLNRVYRKLKRLRENGDAGGRHVELWQAATLHMHEVIDVVWVKAHSAPQEALQVARAGGHQVHWHEMNRGGRAGCERRSNAHRKHWGMGAMGVKYLLEVYQVARLRGQRCGEGGEPMHQQRALGPKSRTRIERTEALWVGQRRMTSWEATQGFDRCGRTSCKGKRQAQLK